MEKFAIKVLKRMKYLTTETDVILVIDFILLYAIYILFKFRGLLCYELNFYCYIIADLLNAVFCGLIFVDLYMKFISDYKIIEYFLGYCWRKIFNEEFRHFPRQNFVRN